MTESPVNAALFDVEVPEIPEASGAPATDLPSDDYAMTELAARRLCDQLNARLTQYRAYPHHPGGHEDMSLLRQGWVVVLYLEGITPLELEQPMSCEDVEHFARNVEGEE